MNSLEDLAKGWVTELPRPYATRLAEALRGGRASVRALRNQTAAADSLAAAGLALDAVEAGDGLYLAGLLQGWLDATSQLVDVRPVWTGPASQVGHSRLTIGVVADLIAEAKSEILLVSYATYPPPSVVTALQAAAARGVEVTLLLERAEDKPGWSGMLEPFPELDAEVLCWPLAERPSGASLHAKALVVDRRMALVGSANLTAFALERNLECGLLLRGGPVPGQLADHLRSANGIRPV